MLSKISLSSKCLEMHMNFFHLDAITFSAGYTYSPLGPEWAFLIFQYKTPLSSFVAF